jgi:hypothetical protein
MAHEYHVTVDDGDETKTHSVQVEDENHHTNWKDVGQFFSYVASILLVTESAIKGVKWIRKL